MISVNCLLKILINFSTNIKTNVLIKNDNFVLSVQCLVELRYLLWILYHYIIYNELTPRHQNLPSHS